jgi:alpha-L-rhamnosidase
MIETDYNPRGVFLLLFMLAAASRMCAGATAPPLQNFSTIVPDDIGRRLQAAFIWSRGTDHQPGTAVEFRRSFTLQRKPSAAVLQLFADARYILWVNGEYVQRGPARFQPNGPEYDSIDIAGRLRAGLNVVALVVVGNLSGGKVMLHRPGLTASLQIDGEQVFRTDATWKCNAKTRYTKVVATWPNLGDAEVDAQAEDGDWTLVDYSDARWSPAVTIPGDSWGALTARRIPLLRESPVKFSFTSNTVLPVTLHAGEKLGFKSTRIVQAYPLIDFTADKGSQLSIEPYDVHYIAKAGAQEYFPIDTRGITSGTVVSEKGTVTITDFKLIERLYPYDRVGTFECSDPFLNQLWAMCARSCEVLSEDSYVDCADRERVEWMDDDPPGFDITRTAMAGPGADGKPVFSDPRLLGELIRRTAMTLQPDGWVKAHTCSDRFDIHAKMEDRACDWVSGIRRWVDATGDLARVREIWPAVAAQMDYFLKRRTDKGLVSARDWVVWGNPLGYATGQTTTLNAFVQSALSDSAYLAGLIGEKADETRFAKAATDLKTEINAVLWDQQTSNYYGGYFDKDDVAATMAANKNQLVHTPGFVPSTLHANLFALDRGVVPADRRQKTIDAMLGQIPKRPTGANMLYYYLAKQLYELDEPKYDVMVLSIFREGWREMVSSPLDCSWESFRGGSHAHIYGMYPGYFLSAYVLGVRRDQPVALRTLLIEPHLADLKHASGVVVTEFGPVPVSWNDDGGRMNFTFSAPPASQTTLALALKPGDRFIQLDGKTVQGTAAGTRTLFQMSSGEHSGWYSNIAIGTTMPSP